MLTSDFKEKSTNEIELPAKNADEILELLKMIYPCFINDDIDEMKIDCLLRFADEYDMIKLKRLIEKHLIKKLDQSSGKKLYGKPAMVSHLEFLMDLIEWSTTYGLNNLRDKTIDHMANKFDKKFLDTNAYYMNRMDGDTKLLLLNKKLELMEEAAKSKEMLLKQMRDDLLRQKFEIQRLNKNLN